MLRMPCMSLEECYGASAPVLRLPLSLPPPPPELRSAACAQRQEPTAGAVRNLGETGFPRIQVLEAEIGALRSNKRWWSF